MSMSLLLALDCWVLDSSGSADSIVLVRLRHFVSVSIFSVSVCKQFVYLRAKP